MSEQIEGAQPRRKWQAQNLEAHLEEEPYAKGESEEANGSEYESVFKVRLRFNVLSHRKARRD